MQIEREDARRLIQALDLDDDAVREDYSGRGMYGRTCFGIVVDQYTPVVLLGVALHDVFGEDAWDIARSASQDSMGLGTIIYFPGYELEPLEEDEEELV